MASVGVWICLVYSGVDWVSLSKASADAEFIVLEPGFVFGYFLFSPPPELLLQLEQLVG